MKFSRYMIIILIIFTILCDNSILSKKNTLSSKTNTKNKSIAITDIISTIDGLISKTKKNIMYFIMGVLSYFIDDIDGAFDKLVKLDSNTNVLNSFDPCFAQFQKKSSSDSLSGSPISKMEKKTGSRSKNQEFCEATKQNIIDYYVKTEKEEYKKNSGFFDAITPDFLSDAVFRVSGKLTTKKKFCTNPRKTKLAKDTQKEIKKQYGSLSEYETECLKFHGMDCDEYNPKTEGLKSFAKTAYSYTIGIEKTGTCVSELLNAQDPNIVQAKMIIGNYFKSGRFLSSAMSAMVSLVVNILTGGLWGGVKAGYYIVQLVDRISNFKRSSRDHMNAYKLGKIVGNCITIVKSIFLGRRRRFFKR